VPELPDIVVYLEALSARILGHVLERAEIRGPSLLRTADPPLEQTFGHAVTGLRRIGKRIAIGFDNDLWLVFHLMIAGRLHWKIRRAAGPGNSNDRRTLAVFEFDSGMLTLTEAGARKRASLHLVKGGAGLLQLDPGGIDVLDSSLQQFSEVLTSANHTLKRALTDPRLCSGIGNAYSDEILHHAQLSPIALTLKLKPEEVKRLYESVRQTLVQWTGILRTETGEKFPEKVTAFRDEMAVHGRYGQACPRCGMKVQRIRYASNETNYCPQCQTAGKLLADRSLSRLLREDWPRTPEELEERKHK
jgi:formamidopyrimidine-DNA glycosylase